MKKCYVILEGGLYDGHATKGIYLNKEKGIKEVLFLANEYNIEQTEINKRLNRKVDSSLTKDKANAYNIISYSNSVDFVSLVERDLIV